MPSALVSEADQKFPPDGRYRASVIVHGRNSHENQPQSPQRRRLIASRKIELVAHGPRPASGAVVESCRSIPRGRSQNAWRSARNGRDPRRHGNF